MELAWTYAEKVMTACQSSTSMDIARPQRKREPKDTWKRNLEKEMWTAGFSYS